MATYSTHYTFTDFERDMLLHRLTHIHQIDLAQRRLRDLQWPASAAFFDLPVDIDLILAFDAYRAALAATPQQET